MFRILRVIFRLGHATFVAKDPSGACELIEIESLLNAAAQLPQVTGDFYYKVKIAVVNCFPTRQYFLIAAMFFIAATIHIISGNDTQTSYGGSFVFGAHIPFYESAWSAFVECGGG